MSWNVIGQERAVDLLRRTVAIERPAHAYLFVGPPQVGKRALALTFAQALNCEQAGRPCGVCRQCRRIASGAHPDLFVVGLATTEGRARKEIGIDQMRDLQRQVHLRPYDARYKVFIVDGAEHLSTEASNAVLKTLEEPPPHAVLCLITASESELLSTVRSRCQRVELYPVPRQQIESALIERWSAHPDRAARVARLAVGRLGWAVEAIADESVLTSYETRLAEVGGLLDRPRTERLEYAAKLAGKFSSQRDTVEGDLRLWLGWWRDLLLAKTGHGHLLTHEEDRARLEGQAERLSLEDIRHVIHSVWEALDNLAANVNPRLALDTLVLSVPEHQPRA